MNIRNLFKSLKPVKIFFSSGFRNSHLLSMFDDTLVEHGFLDQSLAFQALGVAKVSQQVCVVCLTSGTAVAQALPAIIEAYYTKTKLVVVSADRSSRLNGSGAPQTIDQNKILKQYCRSFLDISFGDENLSFSKDLSFPLHINIRIEELGISETYNLNNQKFTRPLIVLNSCDNSEVLSRLKKILIDKKLNVYQDLGSPFYSETFPGEIMYESQVDKYIHQFDSMIRVGSVSNARFWRRIDDKVMSKFHLDANGFKGCESGELLLPKDYSDFLDLIESKAYQPIIVDNFLIDDLMSLYPNSEISLMNKQLQNIKEDEVIFCGNSMPIRYLKFFKIKNRILMNRGANGIDGLVSTAIGMAKHYQRSLIHAFVGDLSLMYDSAILLKNIPENLVIHVFNNKGGRIFERVSQNKEIINSHNISLTNLFGKSINEILVDLEQTRLFWRDFESRLG